MARMEMLVGWRKVKHGEEMSWYARVGCIEYEEKQCSLFDPSSTTNLSILTLFYIVFTLVLKGCVPMCCN
jgi:hypothetical protein